jgi:uncharacterized membrane protein YeaQ/YmgE (transglycosylase-associated protein family)
MSLLTWMITGSICGWLFAFFLRIDKRSDRRINVLAGIVGAVAAGIYITPLFGIVTTNQKNFSFASMFLSLGGALILIVSVYFYRRISTRAT